MQVNANSIGAHFGWMANNSNNVANVNTENFQSTQTTIQEGAGVGSVQAVSDTTANRTDLAKELTEQIPIENAVEANVVASNTKDEMLGSLLDIQA